MGIQDQLKEILRLLEAAKDDLKDWIETNEDSNLELETGYTEELISEIETLLHEVGY